MKKFFVAITTFLLSLNVLAANQPFENGKEYITLDQPRSSQPEVIEFFSFYCPHCYNFEMTYKIPQKVKESLPAGTTFKQYHVDFLGRQSQNLTRAWALAVMLGAEEKVKAPLFEKAQVNAFNSMNDIRQVFIDNGISAEQFDAGINSFAVNAFVSKQQQAANDLQVRGVPDFYVNNKYRINPEGFSRSADFIKTYAELANYLLQQ